MTRKIFICDQYGERLAILITQKYQNLWMNNKVRGDLKCNVFAFSSTAAKHLIFNFPRVV